jgi:hypothetical protein
MDDEEAGTEAAPMAEGSNDITRALRELRRDMASQ